MQSAEAVKRAGSRARKAKFKQKFTLKPTVTPSDANTKVVWSTASKKIATVKNGIVTAKNIGATVVTCKFSNGEKLTCAVTVTE